MTSDSLINRLPDVRGRYREQAELASTNWFRVGGVAEVLFKPEDVDDLAHFLQHKPADIPVHVLGVGSNIIIRDGGLDGVVVKLGRGFTTLAVEGEYVIVGAAHLDVNVAQFAAEHGRAGLEFLSGVPGTIGGALRMNAGAYGREVKDVLVEAELVDGEGVIHTLPVDALGYSYRKSQPPHGAIFTRAVFRTTAGDPVAIREAIQAISDKREATQPIRTRTGGSTFKNPPDKKAWELIDAAGCRGMIHGGAQVSEKHCNFLLNTGNATAADLETLGELVREKVKAHSGIELEWEIKRIGKHSN